MHRTEGANNVGGLFTDGPPGTTIAANWLNAIQEEIAYVIEQSGGQLLSASNDTHQQLYTAILALQSSTFYEPSGSESIIKFVNDTTGTGASDGLAVGINVDEQAIFLNYENTDMIFHTNNNERLRITNDGKFSTGGVTSLGASGGLHLYQSDTGLGAVSTGGDMLILEHDGDCGMTMMCGNTDSSYIYFADASDSDVGYIQYDHNINDMIIYVDTAESFRITDDQKISTNGESSPLCASGGMHLYTDSAGTIASVNANGDNLVIEDSGACGITILSAPVLSGGIYFGDQDDSDKSSLVYSHNTDDMKMYMGVSSRQTWDDDGSIAFSNTVYTDVENDRAVYIDSSGNIGTTSSSERYKTNIEPIESPDFIYDLKPVSYEFKKKQRDERGKKIRDEDGRETFLDEGDGAIRFGFIAEEVEKINPQLCIYENEVIDGVRYEDLHAPVIAALQAQKKEIEELKKEIKKLKS